MGTRVVIAAIACLSALAFVAPAGAVTIEGVDYALLARCKIGLEAGAFLVINGNVAVNEACGVQDGLMYVGAGITVNGTASANKMFFSANATVTECLYNERTGGDAAAVCGNIPPAVDPPGVSLPILPAPGWPGAIPLPIPDVTVGTQDVNCSPPNNNPAPGNYRNIVVPDGATCNLSPGTYNARSVLLHFGATLNGNNAVVNLTGGFTTEPSAIVGNVTVTSVAGLAQLDPPVCSGPNGLGTTAEVIETGHGAQVTNAVFYSPCARQHYHQHGTFTNFEGIAVVIVVEPVQITKRPFCACITTVTKNEANSTLELGGGCALNRVEDRFFVCTVDPGCPADPVIAGPNCTAATRLTASADGTSATLAIPAVDPGDYYVVVQSPGGTFCAAEKVTLP